MAKEIVREKGRTPVGRDDPIAPQRKRLDHRGPLSIDVSGAWYFITVCADGHCPWRMGVGDGGMGSCRPTGVDESGGMVGRDDPIAPRAGVGDGGMGSCRPTGVDESGGTVGRDDPIAPRAAYDAIMSTARHFQKIGKWKLALFLVMPDHLHFIVHIPSGGMGSCRPTGLARVIGDFKRSVSRTFGIRFQRDFFDTRLRNDEHYGKKFRYICNNPVRKNLCAKARDWPYVIAFNRETGAEIPHRGQKWCGVCGAPALPVWTNPAAR